MSDLALDVNNEFDVTTGSVELIGGIDAIIQHLKFRFLLIAGEWFRDPNVGVPYFQRIFVKNPDMALLRAIFRRVALTTPGVDELDTVILTYDNATRSLTVRIVGRSLDFGPFIFDTPLVIE